MMEIGYFEIGRLSDNYRIYRMMEYSEHRIHPYITRGMPSFTTSGNARSMEKRAFL